MIGIHPITHIPTVKTVSTRLNPISVNPDQYQGVLATVLRSMSRAAQDFSFSTWDLPQKDGNMEAGGMEVSLWQHPELMFMLARCSDYLVDSDGTPLKVSSETAPPVLQVTEDTISDTRTCQTRVMLDTVSTSEENPAIQTVLTDSFVLGSDGVIYPVDSLSDGAQKLKQLEMQHLPLTDLEDYLSIFYSFVRNVGLRTFDGLRLTDHGETVETMPTLCFEKVDADRALYVRITSAIPDDNDIVARLNLGVRASIGMDKTVTLKHIIRRPLDESTDTLCRIIESHAPTKQARREIYQDEDFFIIPEETAAPFLTGGLPQLLRNFILVGADKLREYKVAPVQPKLRVNLSSGIDFLEGDAQVEFGTETMTLQDVLTAWRKQHYVVLSDGNRAIIADDYMRRLERIFDGKTRKGGKVRVSFFDLPEVEDLLSERLEGEVMQRHRQVYQGFNDLRHQQLQLPPINATLRDYQQEGVKWIKYLYDNHLGGCLADDMGLGKTIQTITVLSSIYSQPAPATGEEGKKRRGRKPKNTEQEPVAPKAGKKTPKPLPTLIVMPRSLVFNWDNEIQKFAPWLNTYIYYGTARDLDQAMQAQVILTTYAVVRNDIEQLKDKKFLYVILDESQNIKNVSAQATQAIHLLHCEHRLALSGTPVENNLTELYSLFRFLNPAMFGTLDNFNQLYTYPIQRDSDKAALAQLQRKIYPFLLRRLKRDVLKELPDRIDQQLRIEMSDQQKRLYEKRRQYYKQIIGQNIQAEGVQKSQFIMFQALNELRQIASIPENFSDGKIASPKIDQLMDSLTEAVENGHKVVVFFNFLTGIELVADRLDKMGIGHVEMTGATTNREKVVARFQKTDDCKVMLMTLKTGGVGLNLTAADTVFIFEPWWNKAAEEQAINRLHRIGQTQKVLSYSIITADTIEDKILQLQQQKAELFESLISSDSSSTKMLSEEDINFILS